ncbi:hypothetical protein [Oricola sp.]|uniref:hypothetical protein n=1 Tax=Oricola sp. TaxID=1979950 RepID=UPI003BAD9206
MKKLVVDLDDTITVGSNLPYPDQSPNPDTVRKLREYRNLGFQIAIYTARNMNTHANNTGLICAKTLPLIVTWLEKHGIPFDEIHVGKPWCGDGGFYVDDKAIRPNEFANLEYDEILSLLEKGRASRPKQGSEEQ